ncbi:type I-E CRISPR-associated protein Cse2/CasB [Streptomyces sp. NPDC002659]|uniref:type I-E CRISPR-associated protein Cse2/CasB n=1 Tax=Streptomyces sp. NPDC002659 TaxID=3364656 RepID=UPI0036C1E1CC
MLTTAQRRTHYDAFVAEVIDLCADNRIRADLASGRGRPVDECHRMQEHLTARIARYGARRAHYTTACLIAMQRHFAQRSPYTPEFATTHPDAAVDVAAATACANPAAPLSGAAAGLAAADATPPDATGAAGESAARPWRSRPNLGTTLAIAAGRHGFKESRMTERVKVLTKLSASQLHPRLWTLAAYLHNRDAARLDWAVLLEDLAWWDYDQRSIATRWRESYFLTLDTLSAFKDS